MPGYRERVKHLVSRCDGSHLSDPAENTNSEMNTPAWHLGSINVIDN